MRFDGLTTPQVATKLVISELSGVTVPAQTGADVAIIKLGSPADLLKSVFDDVLADEKLEQQVREWLNPLWDYNYALREAVEKIMQDETITDKAAALRENVQSYMQQIISLIDKQPKREAATMADTPTTAPVADNNAELALYKALAQMTDAQKRHYQSLPEADKASFINLDADSRDMIVKSAADADESHTMLNGTVISKSSAGAMFDVLKAQDAELRNMRNEQNLQKAAASVAANFANLPGEPMAKTKAVMGLSALDAATRTWVEDTLKAADTLYKERRQPAADPAAGDGGTDPGSKLDALAKAHAAANNVTHAVAYAAVLKTDDGRALYKQLEG